VQVLAGIAKPHAFAAMLREQGFHVTTVAHVADHDPLMGAWPSAYQLDANTATICTAKDAVKLRERPDAASLNIWVAPLELGLPDAFWQALDKHLGACHASTTSPLSLPYG
jgi:tetraacyldisaccharide 4'-kinase